MAEQIRLIALTGRAGAGKDSVAAALVRHRNYRTIAFADAVRAEIAAAWRVDWRMLADPATKEWAIPALAIGNCGDTDFVRAMAGQHDLTAPRSARWLMRAWAQDFQKWRHGDDYYAGQVLRWLRRQVGTGWTRLLVTDLRFLAELEALQQASDRLRVVRVHRPCVAARPDPHVSEREQLFVPKDVDLVNDGSLEDLLYEALRMEEGLWA